MLLQIETDLVNTRARLSLIGELDMSNADELSRALTSAARDASSIEVDLRRLDFIDSSGIRVLVEAELGARRDGYSLTLFNPGHKVRRVFEIAGLLDQLPIASH